MKRSRLYSVLAWCLCAALLLSGALLVFHAGHACRNQACALCPILENCRSALAGAWLLCAAIALGAAAGEKACAAVENRFDPDETPVRQKVKLLN